MKEEPWYASHMNPRWNKEWVTGLLAEATTPNSIGISSTNLQAEVLALGICALDNLKKRMSDTLIALKVKRFESKTVWEVLE